MSTDKKSGNLKDAQPWKVAYTQVPTVPVKDETFDSFSAANLAAKKYTLNTGLYAAAVRA